VNECKPLSTGNANGPVEFSRLIQHVKGLVPRSGDDLVGEQAAGTSTLNPRVAST